MVTSIGVIESKEGWKIERREQIKKREKEESWKWRTEKRKEEYSKKEDRNCEVWVSRQLW